MNNPEDLILVGEETKRVDELLKDYRLGFLKHDPEFKDAELQLLAMAKRLGYGSKLKEKQLIYLSNLETHVHNLNPHFEKLKVDGEDAEVCFVNTPRGENDLPAFPKDDFVERRPDGASPIPWTEED